MKFKHFCSTFEIDNFRCNISVNFCIQYQQSREGPNCTADLLLVTGSLQWWGVVGSFLMFQGVLWYFWFFRSVEFMGTIVEHDRLLLSRPFGRYWVIHQFSFKDCFWKNLIDFLFDICLTTIEPGIYGILIFLWICLNFTKTRVKLGSRSV